MSEHLIFDHSVPFEERMKHVFSHQHGGLKVYRDFCDALGINPDDVISGETMPPLLPVEAFRESVLSSVAVDASTLRFRSSGTTGMKRSVHYVPYPDIYRKSATFGIRQFYPIDEFVVLAYTPGYSENPESSLIWMLNQFINDDKTGLSRFLDLNEPVSPLAIDAIYASGKRVMLFGAAFGLIDLAETHPVVLPEDSIIIETGGMKTHRRELSREEMHQKLAFAFGLPDNQVHSEYGMSEMLSQAYSDGSGWFSCPHWLKISVRNPENPLEICAPGEEGLIGIIDLANYYSCSFLLTGDRGVADESGRFKVMGRFVPENLRGCNFLIDQE